MTSVWVFLEVDYYSIKPRMYLQHTQEIRFSMSPRTIWNKCNWNVKNPILLSIDVVTLTKNENISVELVIVNLLM